VAVDVAGCAKRLKLDGRVFEWDTHEFALLMPKAYYDSLGKAKRVLLTKRLRWEMRQSLIPRAPHPRTTADARPRIPQAPCRASRERATPTSRRPFITI
jgi:hypothetical protein